ncbi:hypothetical protein BS47DRAFT_1483921 [Hydnum rufescens UP504]|uniref:Uncharacterized protein n=1 Tax=Hydnum rufescens UP504 TaxID=1448309 RepID=A0A9P6B5A9_9AGAM|nr:hypothetical protein BS47DRAFT_1483921 [Hydnum rufescens UP504]
MLAWVAFFVYFPTALCDTEIVNFISYLDSSTWLPSWPISQLDLEVGTQFSIQCAPVSDGRVVWDVCEDIPFGKCPYESWFIIPVDSVGYKTLRVSWPASYPAEFSIRLFTPSTLMALIEPSHPREHPEPPHHSQTQDPMTDPSPPSWYYVRILAKSRGVRTPPLHLPSALSFLAPFIRPIHSLLLLCPRLVPRSLLSTLAFLACAVTVASRFVVPPITRFLEKIARSAVATHEMDIAAHTKKST